MKNKRTKIIIALQALLILMLFWMLIFYGRDEYANYRSEQHEEIEGLNRVVEEDGISMIRLSSKVQKNSGIRTVKVQPSQHKSALQSVGNVVSIDPLMTARTQYLTLKANLDATRATSVQNTGQYQRLSTLNADNKNVSDRVLQEAQALVEADQAKIAGDKQALDSLRAGLTLQWGETLAKLATDQQLPRVLSDLANRKNVLVQLSLPEAFANPKTGDSIGIAALNAQSKSLTAQFISPATQSDASLSGSTFYYSAPAAHLRVGMRIKAEIDTDQQAAQGVIIPSDAVVWYAGQSWAYVKQGGEEFIRKPVSTDMEVESGWFNQQIKPNTEVVVVGAQLLLSEEFKYLIKNENED